MREMKQMERNEKKNTEEPLIIQKCFKWWVVWSENWSRGEFCGVQQPLIKLVGYPLLYFLFEFSRSQVDDFIKKFVLNSRERY